MSTELNGPGPIAGDYMGGSGDNLNESPDSSTPGGGSNGTGGNDGSNSSAGYSAARRQIDEVVNDPAVKTKLSGLIKGAKAINPNAHLSITELTESGTLKLGITDITADQAWDL